MTADADLDRLYGVRPEEFTALRTDLAAGARKRGDADAAKQIAAARRPTIAAWVVNTLVRRDDTAAVRLADLSERLRTAHAAMDGGRIRELSAAQRALVDELVRAGFTASEVADPSPALRDDVTGTLQAAIADPEVAARLGVLSKAERFSGFGDFGASADVVVEPGPVPSSPTVGASVVQKGPSKAEVNAARKRRARAAAAREAAEVARAEAAEERDDRRTKVNTARRRYEKLLESLAGAQRELDDADAEHVTAEHAFEGAADRLAAAEAELAQADSVLAAVTATSGDDPA